MNKLIYITTLLSLFLLTNCNKCYIKYQFLAVCPQPHFDKSQLVESTTIQIIESQFAKPTNMNFNKSWIEFKSIVKKGDKIWYYSSSTKSWENMMGRAGWVIIRNNVVIAELIYKMN